MNPPGKAVAAPAPASAGITPDAFAQFLAVQAKQNEIREKEVEVQKFNAETERTKMENAHEYALKSLDAQVNDRKDERKTQSGDSRLGFWIVLIVVVGLLAIIAYALSVNKEQFIVEIIKLLAVGGGGGGVGYAIGVRKGDKSGSTPSAP